MIRFLRKLSLASLFIISSIATASETMFVKDDFILAIVKSPVGSYYGNPFIRHLVEYGGVKGVHTVYLRPTITRTNVPSNYQLSLLADRIQQTHPKIVLAEQYIIDGLKSELPQSFHNKLRPFAFEDLHSSFSESYTKKLRSFLDASNFTYDQVYVLHDNTSLSTERALRVKGDLIKAKFPSKAINLVTVKNYHSIGAELRKLNSKTPSIIINTLSVLSDVEINKLKFGDDAKKAILASNGKHLDIGFWEARFNEALILKPNPKSFFNRYVMGQNVPIEVELFVNKNRLDLLKMRHLYINGVEHIDGIVDQ